MREIDRIDSIVSNIAMCWKKCPDLRFMQLMCIIQGKEGKDCFYMEDEDFIEKLKDIVNI